MGGEEVGHDEVCRGVFDCCITICSIPSIVQILQNLRFARL